MWAGWPRVALAMMVCLSCGDIYRPVVIPIAIDAAQSGEFSCRFRISANAQINPGRRAADRCLRRHRYRPGEIGINPTHAAILPNNSRVFRRQCWQLFSPGSPTWSPPSRLPSAARSQRPGYPNHLYVSQCGTHRFRHGSPVVLLLPSRFFDHRPRHQMYVANYGVDNDPGCANLASTDSVAVLSNRSSTSQTLPIFPRARTRSPWQRLLTLSTSTW